MHGTRDRPYGRRQDPELAPRFAKDAGEERFLAWLNDTLALAAEAELLDLDDAYPTLHVVGPPRSGTTLLYQLVASGLELGYVNHLTAALWRAPVAGIRLSRKLGLDRPRSSFESSFGRTSDPSEPHEFGYFWNERLGYPDLCEQAPGHDAEIDWDALRRVLVNMAHAAGGPIVFKPMLLLWHLETMVERMPRTCYAWIRRDPVQTALSLLAMRRSVFGSVDRWASLRPGGPDAFAGEPPWRQVAAQVVLLERTLERAYARLGDEHVAVLRYEDVCADPREALDRIRELLGSKGFEPVLRDVDLPAFAPRGGELAAEYGDRVAEAVAHYSAALPR